MVKLSHILELIENEYSLKIVSTEMFSGYVNKVYKLVTTDSKVYYARSFCLEDKELVKKCQNEIKLLSYFEKKSQIKLDYIIKTAKNKNTFIYKNEVFSLRKEIPGKTLNHGLMNKNKRFSIGKLLGNFHNIAFNFPKNELLTYDYNKYFLPIIFHLTKDDLVDLIDNTTKSARKSKTLPSKVWLSKKDALIKYVLRYCVWRKKIKLPNQIIHGDLDPTNITFVEDQAIGLMDWDFLQCSPRVLDLANSTINRPVYRDDLDYKFSFNEVNEFLSGYQTTIENKLSKEEIRAIPFAFLNMGLQYVLAASFLFNKEIPEKKFTDFLLFRFIFLEKLDSLGNNWYQQLVF